MRRAVVKPGLFGGLSEPIRTFLVAVVPGIVAGLLAVAFIVTLVVGYWLLSPERSESVDSARALASGPLPEIFFCFCVAGFAGLSGYLGGARAALLGLACGTTAAVTEQLVASAFGGAVAVEAMGYGVLGVGVGFAGGWAGGREADRSVAGNRALYTAMREMARATGSNAVAASVASVLGGAPPVGVGVWRQVSREDAGGPDGIWRKDATLTFAPERLIKAAEFGALGERPRVLRAHGLPPGAREEWERQGVRSALVAPLLCAEGEPPALVFVGFTNATRAARLFASWGSRRRLLSAATAAAMALEKRENERRTGVLQERARLGRGIHDSLIQCLAGIVQELDGAKRADMLGKRDISGERSARALEAARLATAEARRLVNAMRPEMLDGAGLPEALAAATRRALGGSGIGVRCELRGEPRRLRTAAEEGLFLVCQEALHNIRKHSGASEVVVSLDYLPDGVVMEVEDDGVGFTLADERPKTGREGGGPGSLYGRDGGFGTRSMRERAESLGGRLLIESPAGRGTKVVAELPEEAG